MTGQQLIESALRIVTGGTEFTPEQLDNALTALNSLKDSWSSENFLQFDNVLESFALSIGVNSYSVGPTGDFVTARPTEVNNLFIREGSNDYPIKIITDGEYEAISPKDGLSSYPYKALISKTVPDITIDLWPEPSKAFTLFISSYKVMADFTLDGDVNLPPAYARAFKFNLAVDSYPEYSGATPSQTVLVLAADTKKTLKKSNTTTVPSVQFDIGVQGNRYNIYRGY